MRRRSVITLIMSILLLLVLVSAPLASLVFLIPISILVFLIPIGIYLIERGSTKADISYKEDMSTREVTISKEKGTTSVKYLVICPYCGAKNEQGIFQCQKCKADL